MPLPATAYGLPVFVNISWVPAKQYRQLLVMMQEIGGNHTGAS